MDERLLPGGVSGDLTKAVKGELRTVSKIALPTVVARVGQFGVIVITQLFLGHVSDLDLAAYALVQTVLVRFANGILNGMSSATETLCGQAFGAAQYRMMGVYLQRSWIVDGVAATILVPLFLFATSIFRLVGQEADISAEAGKLALWFIPFVYSLVFNLTSQMYLQAQGRNMIIAWVSAASFLFHVPLSWLLVNKLGAGASGALAALNISSWAVVVGELVFICGGWCPLTWKGLTKDAFVDIIPIVKLSISSGIMMCLELWYNSVLIIVAGYMKNATVAVSAFSICLNINAWVLMIGLGFMVAASVRVSNELGKGDPQAVKFSIKVLLTTSGSMGIFFCVLCLSLGRNISYLFTDNEEVADSVSRLSVLLSFNLLFNSIQTVLIGIVIGAGLQSMSAVVNLGSYYLIGVPVGAFLAYATELHVYGLWIGLLIGVVIQTLSFSYIIWSTDWDKQVMNASERLGRWFLKPEEEENCPRQRMSA